MGQRPEGRKGFEMSLQLNKSSETGLYDQQVFMLLAVYELSRAQRYPSPVTLLHISVNQEQASSEIAESVEQLFANILNTSLRVSDIPAHYGKDFLVLMPATDERGAKAASSRLIARLKGTRNFANGNLFKYEIHIGIATHPGGQGTSIDKLIEQATDAMQNARKDGPQGYKIFSE
jgi:diguanylate cyclase (GGDEF)-like protein